MVRKADVVVENFRPGATSRELIIGIVDPLRSPGRVSDWQSHGEYSSLRSQPTFKRWRVLFNYRMRQTIVHCLLKGDGVLNQASG